MPVDRDHAFADGVAFARMPPRWWSLAGWTPEARAETAWKQFDRGAQVAAGVLLGPNAWCVNSLRDPAFISLAERVVCRGLLRIEQFGSGRIKVGADSYIGDDCLLSSSAGISIGSHVLIAHGVQIFDNDSHPIGANERAADYASIRRDGSRGAIAAAPIGIGDGAWIGFGSIVVKGVNVGRGAVVGAGSVVTRDVPENVVVAGNPAVVIKQLA